MAKPALDLTGDLAVKYALENFTAKYVRKAIAPTLRDAQKKVTLEEAKRRAPVGESGQLKRSLKVRVAKTNRGKRMPRGTIGYAVVSAKTSKIDAFYSGFVFLGAKNVGRNKRKRQGSFTLRNALYKSKTPLFKMTRSKLAKAIPVVARQMKQDAEKKTGDKAKVKK